MSMFNWLRPRGRFVAGGAVLSFAILALVIASAGSAKPEADRYSYVAAAQYLYGKDYPKHLDKKANPKLSPIALGWVNTDNGVAGRPHLTPIAQMTVKMINDHLGGINGHPVVLHTCIMNSNESDGQACAQQMANDNAVKLILQAHSPVGGTSFKQTLDGAKPVVGTVPNAPDIGAKNVWELSGGRFVGGAIAQWMADIGVKKMAYLTGNIPVLVDTYNTFKTQATGHINTTGVFFDVTAPDISPTIIAANLKQYDYVYSPMPSASLCIPIEKAFAAQGITGNVSMLVNSVCLDSSIKQAMGDLAKFDYLWFGPNIYAKFSPTGQVAAYIQAARDAKTITDINAEPASGFLATAQVMFAASLYRQLGPNASIDQLEATIPKQTATTFMGPPALRFGCFEGYPNFGAIGFRIYHYLGKGKFKAGAAGQWRQQKPTC